MWLRHRLCLAVPQAAEAAAAVAAGKSEREETRLGTVKRQLENL